LSDPKGAATEKARRAQKNVGVFSQRACDLSRAVFAQLTDD